ncbi:cytochrome P450 monooxygenase [Aspergillus heteromorphus CBS 117.55]|uniref:Cytochrome P450 monooxygenase n=1 Tax=Aspergillus heteromorphus CBS 117.55 TaxID=1448321 RepID=A0A317VWM9_9EURO|nr:cytochrome P450 monooxygenase [Aspergillus heteromorphus CBS 117.55]PWY78185.1 cytochrome P450 monooxygenase [Aspergillus heteromorphus CBS 117.55]
MTLPLPTLITTLTTLTTIYTLYKLLALTQNYFIARRTRLPIFISPIPSTSILWQILGPTFQRQLQQCLPEWIYVRLDVLMHGWEFRQRAKLHHRLGKVFVVVTMDECSLCVADPAVSTSILARRKDFVQPPVVARFLGFFGPNVLQSNGEDWQRQRRIIAPNLNENIMRTVWGESVRQAGEMGDFLTRGSGGISDDDEKKEKKKKNEGSNDTLTGLRTLAINVLGQAGYGQNAPWTPDFDFSDTGTSSNSTSDQTSGRVSYFKTIAMVTDRFIEAALIPGWIKQLPFMPAYLQRLGREMERVPGYIRGILDEERNSSSSSASSSDFSATATATATASGGKSGGESEDRKTRGGNLLDLLVKFSDTNTNINANIDKDGLYLTESEISGNLWVFTAAGFDTTATTMGYAVMLLAAYPEWQEWVREELHSLSVEKWRYEDVFTRCTRLLAVMYETLRLYTPVLHITRSISTPQQLHSTLGTHNLTPPMNVYVSSQCIHRDADIWGEDVDEFRPGRWIDPSSGGLVVPEKGTFVPWSGGPRVCPGMKMSQVEFVGTMAVLFCGRRCEARRRLTALMEDSVPKLTLQVRRPEEVVLRWVEL